MKPHDSSKKEEIVWCILKPLLKQDKEGRKILVDLHSGKPVETTLKIWLKKHSKGVPSQLSTYISSGGTVGKVINVARADTVNFYESKILGRGGLVLAIFIIGMIVGLYLLFWHMPRPTQYFLVNNPPLQLPGLDISGEQQKKEAQQQVIQYRQEVQRDRSSAVAQTNLGEALRRIGDLEGAAKAQEIALDLKPNLAEAKLGQALIEQDKGNVTEAKLEIQEALKHKDIAAGYHQLAFIAINEEPPDYKGGEIAMRRAIQLEKNTEMKYSYRVALSITLAGQNKVESANNELNIAISMYPNFKLGYIFLGNILFGQNKVDEAITTYKKSLQVNDTRDFCHEKEFCIALIYRGLGEAFFVKGKIDEAITNFNQSITLVSRTTNVDLLIVCNESLGKALIFKGITNKQPENIEKGIFVLDKVRQVYKEKGKVKKAAKLQEEIAEAALKLYFLKACSWKYGC